MSAPGSRLLPAPGPYDSFAERVQVELGYSFPWLGSRPAIHTGPLVLERALWEALGEAAMRLGRAFDEVCQVLLADPGLFEAYIGRSPWQRLMWLTSGGLWHGFARIDLFQCVDGRLQMAEINADTPTGQVEAVEIGAMVAASHPGLVDPNAGYRAAFEAMVRRMDAAQRGEGAPIERVAILYPTDIPEDLANVRMYTRWFEAMGAEVVLGSPFNLGLDGEGRLCVFGQPVDVVLRHYKTDWWGDRPALTLDEAPLADEEALEGPLWAILSAERGGRVTVINPFGSLVPQNKRAMALLTERPELFSAETREAVAAWVPETRRIDDALRHELLAHREAWVLKSDYGCEGEEVLVGRYASEEDWAAALARIVPEAWVAQRFFEIAPLVGESLPNYGVYLVAGRVAGLYVRLDPLGTVTDAGSCAVPALVEP